VLKKNGVNINFLVLRLRKSSKSPLPCDKPVLSEVEGLRASGAAHEGVTIVAVRAEPVEA
jgi:hypothetical protein